MIRLRFLAFVNPPTPEFDALSDDADLPFVPLEAVWSTGLDATRRKPKADVLTGYTRFREGDIVVPKITPTFQADRTTIAAGLEGGVAAGTTELHVVRARRGVDSRYLRYLLSSRPFLHGGEGQMIGVAGQKRVPDAWLRDLPVPITDQQHQRAIANYLDAETARIDALIAKKRRLVEVLGERRSVQMSVILFSRDMGKPTVVDSILGAVPSAWSRMRLRHCVAITVGVVVNPSSYFVDDGVPFIHGSNVHDGWIDTSNLKYLSDASNEALAKSRLADGDVVVVRAGYPGRAAVVPKHLDGANCASILILRRGERLLPGYLCHFLNCREARMQVALAQYGAAQEQINVSDIVDFTAPVPPIDVQEQVVARIDEYLARTAQSIGALQRQIALLLEHRQALITAAVTGDLAVPGVAA